ncbi:MAG TPA: hypothetical protein VJM49_06140, partial [Acidimicrobiales bacterium]|nr:hypothetical protein [Acidimicrobiales bacterium]
PRRMASVVAAVAVVAVGACSTAPEGDGAAASPTFERASGAALGMEEPVANPTDLLAPVEEGSDWTVVGSVLSPDDGVAAATVWTSEDGTEWADETVEASSGRDVSIAAASRGDDGIVAVGRVGDGDEADAALWTQDGDEWRSSTPSSMGGEHEQWAFDVATGPTGILVAGGESVWGDVRPRLWFSADGESWSSVDGGPGGSFDTTGEESVRAVSALGEGFVAVGTVTVDNEQDGVIWYSPDGESWEQLDQPAVRGRGRQDILSVVALNRGIVAGGFSDTDGDGDGEPVVWRSADGRAWQQADGTLPMTDSRSTVSDLAVRSLSFGPSGLIASGGNDWRPRVWLSNNGGASWTELPNPVHADLFQDGVTLRGAARLGDVTVAIAAEPAVLRLEGDRRWQDVTTDAFPKGGSQPFATAVAAGPDATIAAGAVFTAGGGEKREVYAGQLWVEDGDQWDRIDSENLTAGRVMDAVPFAGGFVAVGFEDFGVAAQRETVGDSEPDGVVWVSPNGTEWGRIGIAQPRINQEMLEFLENPTPEMAPVIAEMEQSAPVMSKDPAGGAGTRSLSAVAAIAEGFVAVGSAYDKGDPEPIVLSSADGTDFRAERPAPGHGGPGMQRYDDVCVRSDDTAVAVGVAGSPGSYDSIAAVRTAMGWKAGEGRGLTGAGDQQAYACAANDDGFLMVGSDGRSGDRDARIWTSADGLTWNPVDSSVLGGPGDQWATAVSAVPDGDGWLVAGTDGARGDGDIALWRIDADGEVTRRDAGEAALTGPGEQTVTNIAIDDDGHVTLAGNDYGRVGLWQSDSVDR